MTSLDIQATGLKGFPRFQAAMFMGKIHQNVDRGKWKHVHLLFDEKLREVPTREPITGETNVEKLLALGYQAGADSRY
jgi:hypothetical protein